MTNTYEMIPQATQPEHEPRSIERFFVLDFDRTLIDTDLLAEKIYNAVEMHTNLHKEDLIAEQHRLEENGEVGVVDMWKVIGDALSATSEELDELRRAIIETVGSSSREAWLPGGSELLDLLEQNNADFGIVSRGADGWQRLKLACMGLSEVPAIITEDHHKSRDHLNGWFDDEQGRFVIPPEMVANSRQVVATNIISIDDRAAAFAESHSGISGYWVRTGRNKKEDGLDFGRFKACDDLQTVVTDLNERYFSDVA